jgi:hypothetical protein
MNQVAGGVSEPARGRLGQAHAQAKLISSTYNVVQFFDTPSDRIHYLLKPVRLPGVAGCRHGNVTSFGARRVEHNETSLRSKSCPGSAVQNQRNWLSATLPRASSCLTIAGDVMKFFKTTLALFLLLTPWQASADIIIDATTAGLYNSGLGDLAGMDGPGGFLVGANVSEGDPTIMLGADPGFAFTAAFGADWLNGDYTGGTWSAGPVAIPTTWAVNTETAIVYNFNLASASSLHIDLGVDNGIVVWLNNMFLFGATAPGGASIGEYDIDVASLGPGAHSLRILRADHGSATGFAISADATALRVPEPGSFLLSAIGLFGLGLSRMKAMRG